MYHKLLFFVIFAVSFVSLYALNQPTIVAYEAPELLETRHYTDASQVELLTTLNYLKLEAEKLLEQVEATRKIVPFYSQFTDITDPSWQKVGCGIASLAMIIDYYGEAEAVDTLLYEGINSGAYIDNAGWSHAGLIDLATRRGLEGQTVTLYDLSMNEAFEKLSSAVKEGPVMVSVHYTFEPTNPIPHLAVITGVADGTIYYNDPAEKTGQGSISIEKFKSAWKKRYIEIRPTA